MRSASAAQFVQLAGESGYRPIIGDAGFCNQLEVGPCSTWSELFAVPSADWIPSAVIGLSKKGWPLIDPNFNALDRGLAFKEMSRFYEDSIWINWRGRKFRAPAVIDHLIISLLHSEKDRFGRWKSLMDVHLLAESVEQQNGWTEFVRRCLHEGTSLSAWSGLVLSVNRFSTRVPQSVIDELKPRNTELSVYFSFTY